MHRIRNGIGPHRATSSLPYKSVWKVAGLCFHLLDGSRTRPLGPITNSQGKLKNAFPRAKNGLREKHSVIHKWESIASHAVPEDGEKSGFPWIYKSEAVSMTFIRSDNDGVDLRTNLAGDHHRRRRSWSWLSASMSAEALQENSWVRTPIKNRPST